MKFSIVIAARATLASVLLCSGIVYAQTPEVHGVLVLSASATAEVAKDLLSVTFSTTKSGSDANAVQAQLKQAIDLALAEARKAARPGQLDVQTGNFALSPIYATNATSVRPVITGWQGSTEIVVEGRDTAAIGQLTGRISTMTIARVGFRLSREAGEKVEGDIAAQAIATFRAKAATYAKQFGYGSYQIREATVSTSEPQGGPIPMTKMQASSAAPISVETLSVEPGKATVTATVNGTVQMK